MFLTRLYFLICCISFHVVSAQYRGFNNNPFGLGFGSESYSPIGDAAYHNYNYHPRNYYHNWRYSIY